MSLTNYELRKGSSLSLICKDRKWMIKYHDVFNYWHNDCKS